MKTLYDIAEIEQAINYWIRRQAADDALALCHSARVLADVYGLMIYHHQASVNVAALNAEQATALAMALEQGELVFRG
ncbi:DUF3717 domain-containing protein [Pandoraea sp.]|uniref:DUF3717 domain-containing protein n=1 Tax=Pandoraea sp. TaxID=1883445 RepID=UPI001225711F|nr:DUF3717 domain-containing protein [Pandoraea sp.]TAL53839.1 MAG: DUF3717 domain-containing protein [Pandoraea sp.]TAM17092.1 MAG: DUF3717 domain-containing protein [Pandoraea sp.]